MKTIKSNSIIEGSIILQLTEKEARALNEFARFGAYKDTQEFIHKHWANNINLEELKNFFDTAHAELSPHLSRFDVARRAFDLTKKES